MSKKALIILILDLDYRAKYYEQETKSWLDRMMEGE